jgi:NAD(P)H-flavin reductase
MLKDLVSSFGEPSFINEGENRPSVSFWSFAQSHPFVVISWAVREQDSLDLFVEPRSGLTRELLNHAKNSHAIYPLVMFSGPHGRSISMEGYETVLMVASGFGIAAQLPYLKHLIHGERFAPVGSTWFGRSRIKVSL